MKNLGLVLMISLVFLVMNCSSVSVKHDYDSQADFASLQTFDWMSRPEQVPAMARPLMDKRIKNAVTSRLVSKGLRQSSNPDFLIAYHAGVQDKIDVETWGYSYARRGRFYGWSGTHVDVQQYKQGTLVLDFVDAESKELVWRGVATGAVPDNPTPEKMDKKVNEAVAKILEKFPPM